MQLMLKRRLCSMLIVLLGAAVYAGTATAETYTYDLSGDVSIWDMSGTYGNDELGDIGLNVSYNLTQDAKGKLTGGGSASGVAPDPYDPYGEGYPFDLTFTVTGSVTQSGGVTHIKITMKFKGTITEGNHTYRFRATLSMNMDVDPELGMMTGTIGVSVSVMGYTQRIPKQDYELPIPEGMDGSADLTIDVTQDGKKVTGTGSLQLSNGDTYGFAIKGTFSAKKNLDTLTLTSQDKWKLTLKIDTTDHSIDSFKGKVLGQSLKAEGIEAK
jgi:hypothetical protein